MGKALLAWERAAFRERYLEGPLSRPTRYSLAEPGRLRADLERTLRRGYATTKEEMTLGSCSVAAPVLVDGRAVAAVGAVVRPVGLDPRRLAPPVVAAARNVAARLVETADDPHPGYEHDRPAVAGSWLSPSVATRRGSAAG